MDSSKNGYSRRMATVAAFYPWACCRFCLPFNSGVRGAVLHEFAWTRTVLPFKSKIKIQAVDEIGGRFRGDSPRHRTIQL